MEKQVYLIHGMAAEAPTAISVSIYTLDDELVKSPTSQLAATK